MSEHEQIKHFGTELDALVSRFANEYDVAYASIIGTLFMKAALLTQQSADQDDED